MSLIFFVNYDFASFWKVRAFGGMNYGFGGFGSIYEGVVMTTPNYFANRMPQSDIMPETLSKNIGVGIEYRNPLNNLFMNARYRFGFSKKNLITAVTRNGSLFSSNVIAYDNTAKSQSSSVEVGKYFPKFRSNISVNFGNSDSESISMLNNTLIFN
ncbi:TonB-dependent receptor [Riemerella columbipharyngis]|uniref:Outer membrane protein beta-barrel family protein n=1 Tax=Riemerella columbipharyngis TaxID=1071918 RepID=A0A1G6YWP1_9FLAO|nr:hypothetical protein [Riemerella columbipharyngis]SDD94065.1 hypothetical protein SAMN05421544_101273 [Riemerella columbipharyngis]